MHPMFIERLGDFTIDKRQAFLLQRWKLKNWWAVPLNAESGAVHIDLATNVDHLAEPPSRINTKRLRAGVAVSLLYMYVLLWRFQPRRNP